MFKLIHRGCFEDNGFHWGITNKIIYGGCFNNNKSSFRDASTISSMFGRT
jgi:hypothetical protein